MVGTEKMLNRSTRKRLDVVNKLIDKYSEKTNDNSLKNKYGNRISELLKNNEQTSITKNTFDKYISIGYFLTEYGHNKRSDFSPNYFYLSNSGKVILDKDGFPDMSNKAKENSINNKTGEPRKTVGGRFFYPLGPHWKPVEKENRNIGWKKNNKSGFSTSVEFAYLLDKDRLVNFIKNKIELNKKNKKYDGLIKVIEKDGYNFIKMLEALVNTYNNGYLLRGFILYSYIQNYPGGKLPKFKTSTGKDGTILSPLYSAFYDILNKERKDEKQKERKMKRKTTNEVKKQMKKRRVKK